MKARQKPDEVVTRQTKWSQADKLVTLCLACVLFIGQTAAATAPAVADFAGVLGRP